MYLVSTGLQQFSSSPQDHQQPFIHIPLHSAVDFLPPTSPESPRVPTPALRSAPAHHPACPSTTLKMADGTYAKWPPSQSTAGSALRGRWLGPITCQRNPYQWQLPFQKPPEMSKFAPEPWPHRDAQFPPGLTRPKALLGITEASAKRQPTDHKTIMEVKN